MRNGASRPRVAQRLEQGTHNLRVVGSNPTPRNVWLAEWWRWQARGYYGINRKTFPATEHERNGRQYDQQEILMADNNPSVASPEELEKIGAVAAGFIADGQAVGLGSGRAAHAFVRMLAERMKREKLKIVGVPTSESTARLARECGIELVSLQDQASLDITVDGADEVDPALHLLKGGGGDLLREKVVASVSRRMVVVVGHEKIVPRLGTYFPVFLEIVAFAMPTVIRAVTALGAVCTPRLRPDGTLFLTDNHNPLLHARLPAESRWFDRPQELDRQLRTIPGIIETGLFLNLASDVLVAQAGGTVRHLTRGGPA